MATTACLPMYSPSILQQHTLAPRAPRRIRFAPLPDPRRSVLITDNGEELPLSPLPSSSFFPAVPTPSPTPADRSDYFAGFDAASSCSSSSDSKLNSDSQELSSSSSASSISAAPTPPISATPSENSPSESSPPPLPCPSSSSKKSFSFLRSLKRSSRASSSSSSNTLTPVASVDRTPNASTTFSCRTISAEEILTLGTINLFRTSSRDTSEAEASSAWKLTRWSSAGSTRDPYNGSPLYRVSSAQSTRSTQSYQSNSTLKPKAKMPKRPSRLGPPNRKGTRMLNGRVYGGKPNANPFANARDEEPTFVEWGYGGMGSVRGATSAGAHGRWERLQESPQDEDDGSGLAWVKKRKEQRERENKAKEEEKQSKTDAVAVTQDKSSPASSPSPPLAAASATTSLPTDDEHVMRAVNIPAPHRYIRHSHSRSTSRDGIVDSQTRETKVAGNESDGSRSSASDSDSDEEHEDDSSSSGEDEEEDEEEERKTVLGAGVEKISRHH